ncbi:MAG: Ig-like domain-containing protein, partial [Perlucidibaca sp.]
NDVGTQGLASTLKIGSTTIKASATVDGVTYEDSTTLTVTAVELVSVQVTPTNPDVAKGLKQQFTAMATYSDNSVVDVTQDSNTVWSSSDEAVATVSNATDTKGLVGTVNTGSSEIKAVFGGQTGSSTINVVPVTVSRIDITPTTPSVAKGRTLNLTATAVFNDNSTQNVTSTVTWSSSDRSVADIGNASGSKGLVVASKVGKTTITATLGAKSGTTELTVTPAELVTISVAPAAAKLAKGYQLQFQATGTFSDGSKADVTSVVTWTSNASSTASVSNAAGSQGLVKGLAAGSATITAVDPATFLQGSQSMQVTDATLTSIDVTAGNPASATPSLAKGKTLQFSALGHFSDATTLDLSQQVTWSSDDLTIATISNADDSNGLATALKEGAVAITATVADGTAGSATLTVTSAVLTKIEVAPASASLVKGLSQPYQATGTYSDNTTADITTQVTWSSDDAAIASVSNAAGSEGVVKGTGVGGTSISAVLDGVTGAADVTVTAAELTEVQVSTSNASVAVGDKPQFVATGLYTDGSTQDLTDSVVWSSSDLTVADVSNASGSEGLVTALKAGSTDITASFASKSGKATLTVTAAEVRSLEITPANPSMPKGTTLKLKATAVYSDGSRVVVTDTVTWSSADNAKATVSNDSGNKGLVAANGLGEVVISASNGTVTGSTKVTVTAAALTSISVAPASGDGSVPAGGYTLQYQATGTYSDGSTADITTQVTWSSLDENVAAASNTAGQKGLVTSAGAGGTLVVATLGSVTGSGAVTVTNATLQSISVTPTGRTLNNNATLQFAASGTFSDGTVLVLTKQVVWASSNTNLVTISNAKDSEGLATATGLVLLPTNVTISATRSGITGSTTVSRAP